MANLTVYLLKVANLRTVDRHLRYPGNLHRTVASPHSCLSCGFIPGPSQVIPIETSKNHMLVVKLPRKIQVIPTWYDKVRQIT